MNNDIIIIKKNGYILSFGNKKTRLISTNELQDAEKEISNLSNGEYKKEKATHYVVLDNNKEYPCKTEAEAIDYREYLYNDRAIRQKIESKRLAAEAEKQKEDKEYCEKIEKSILSGNGKVVDLEYYVQIKNIKIPLSKRRTLNTFYWGELTNGRVTTLRGGCSLRTANTLIEYIRSQIE